VRRLAHGVLQVPLACIAVRNTSPIRSR
jgi:hypothetical protein